ncbi:3-dehydroquinate synthase [Lactococcus hircilactis]|uniref:3-dehydroquinate synthase n=1 Tax=Lactococcus hircilactis TaxID=1494462 RepID=A0A7X1Z8S7_9LACT|nr:3-dehydroquinate synthase [Lactococcus hircilactis]MQW39364.1 3-dehydroquinate synthase [Lactococcus hircilactis]
MKLNVNLKTHPYDLIIERASLTTAGNWVASLWNKQKILLISDDHVFPLYGQTVEQSLLDQGFEVAHFVFKAGEASKNLNTANEAWSACAAANLTRSDGVIALGGGVVGDLAAFVASTYMRGIHFLQIPTSLTAQVDSSIGGKTAINSEVAKNMIGTFTQPDGVLIDPDVLTTLGTREFCEGVGEVIKCGLIADRELWELLKSAKNAQDLLENHAEAIIYRSCEVKRKVVVEDEHDYGVRLHLNFGHTIGHAVELTAGYGQVMHGEAVAIGMVQISKVAGKKGLMPEHLFLEIAEMARKFNLPTQYDPWDEAALFQALLHDKKGRGKNIKIILVPEIGRAEIHAIEFSEMKAYLEK